MAEISWIKIKTDMFDDEKIKLIERMPEGDTILIIWVKLIAYAGKVNCNGYIMIAEDIPMNVEEMAVIFNRPLEKVRYAIQILTRYRMVEFDENETISITNWEKHQNVDGMEKIRLQTAARVNKYREKKKQLKVAAPENRCNVTSNATITQSNATEEEEELELELREREREREEEKKKKELPSPLIDQNFLQIKNYFETKVIYQESSYKQNTDIGIMVDDYEKDLIIRAMDVAVDRGIPNLSYINGILRAWHSDGITNIKQLQAKEVQANAKTRTSVAGIGTTKQQADARLQQEVGRFKKLLQ